MLVSNPLALNSRGSVLCVLQDAMPKLERERKVAAEERSAANAARAKLEVDVTDLEEQREKHAQTQAGSSVPASRALPWWMMVSSRVGLRFRGTPPKFRDEYSRMSIRNSRDATVIAGHYQRHASRQILLGGGGGGG